MIPKLNFLFRTKSFVLLLIFIICSVSLISCDPTPLAPTVTKKYDFELLIPKNMLALNYLAISGLKISQQIVSSGDSLLETKRVSYYAQATHNAAVDAYKKVSINDNELKRHSDTDTLRIPPTSDQSLYQFNKWYFGFEQDSAALTVLSIEALDTILPLISKKEIRGDEDLKVTWEPISNNNYEMYLQMKTKDYTYTASMPDRMGEAIIAVENMKKLHGSCTFSLVRYRQQSINLGSKEINVLRVSQRDFDLNIL